MSLDPPPALEDESPLLASGRGAAAPEEGPGTDPGPDPEPGPGIAPTQVLSIISRRLREPLQHIVGAMSHLSTVAPNPMPAEARLRSTIRSASRDLVHLANNVIDVVAMLEGTVQLVESVSTIDRLFDTVLRSTVAFDRTRVSLHLDVAQDLTDVVVCDEMRLKQVILSLLNSALRNTALGSVILSVTRAEEPAPVAGRVALRVAVQDTGVKMTPTDLGEVRALATAGTPLPPNPAVPRRRHLDCMGLVLVRHILGLHSTRLEVGSDPNLGTHFSFTVVLRVP